MSQQVRLPHSMKIHQHLLWLCVASHRVIIKALLDVTGRIKQTEVLTKAAKKPPKKPSQKNAE